jgi:predicted dehydrogenase
VTIRIAVVGAGHMGTHHARKVSELARSDAGVRLVAVCDLELERARTAVRDSGASAHRELGAALADADAAIVAVPTVAHHGVVEEALERGLDVLVEKPIATSVAEAEKLVTRARELGRILQVGHLEWFNAAMRRVRSRIRRVRFVEAHRLGPFPGRATDVDVVRDLMIHDLDIVQRLVGEEPDRVDAVGIPVLSGEIDIANARLHFPGGCVANLTASRVSPTPLRKMRFFQPDGYFSIDFLEQAVVIARRHEPDAAGERRIEVETLSIDRDDALLGQLRAFLDAVRTRRIEAGAAVDGISALRTALRIVEEMPPVDELVDAPVAGAPGGSG